MQTVAIRMLPVYRCPICHVVQCAPVEKPERDQAVKLAEAMGYESPGDDLLKTLEVVRDKFSCRRCGVELQGSVS